MSDPIERKCRTCGAYEKGSQHCRKRAPVICHATGLLGFWPIVKTVDWCAEWEMPSDERKRRRKARLTRGRGCGHETVSEGEE